MLGAVREKETPPPCETARCRRAGERLVDHEPVLRNATGHIERGAGARPCNADSQVKPVASYGGLNTHRSRGGATAHVADAVVIERHAEPAVLMDRDHDIVSGNAGSGEGHGNRVHGQGRKRVSGDIERDERPDENAGSGDVTEADQLIGVTLRIGRREWRIICSYQRERGVKSNIDDDAVSRLRGACELLRTRREGTEAGCRRRALHVSGHAGNRREDTHHHVVAAHLGRCVIRAGPERRRIIRRD